MIAAMTSPNAQQLLPSRPTENVPGPIPTLLAAAWLLAVAALLVAVLPATASASASPAATAASKPHTAKAPLRLDRSFGRRGVAEPKLPPHYASTSVQSLGLGPGGSVIAGRHDGYDGEGLLNLQSYDASGHLIRGSRTESEISEPEATEPNGYILRANSGIVERFLPDGKTPDPGFGADLAHGRTFSDALGFKIESLLPTPSGKIVAAGSLAKRKTNGEQIEQIAVARLDHVGKLDPSFGGDGIVKLDDEDGVAAAGLAGVAPLGSESAVVVVNDEQTPQYEGEAVEPGGSTVVALAPNGALDPAYGTGGTVRSPNASVVALAPLADGGLLLAGDSWGAALGRKTGQQPQQRSSDLYAARLTPGGQLDPGFGSGGVTALDFGGQDLTATLLLGADGSIVLGGSSTTSTDDAVCVNYEGFCDEVPVLARLLPNGAPDPGFGSGGKVLLASLREPYVGLGTGRGALVLAALPGGGILAGGGSGTAGFLAELTPDGTPAAGFGQEGVAIERDPESGETETHALAVDARRRILVAGATGAGALYSFEAGAVFRFRADGSLDRSYGRGSGFARVPGNTRAIALGAGGDAFVLSGKYAPSLVVHLTTHGTLDRHFGEDGVAPLPPAPRLSRRKGRFPSLDPRSLLALPGGGVIVGGELGDDYDTRVALVRFDRRGHLVRNFGRRGVDVLALGRTGQCNMTQLALDRRGRILIAGRVRERGEFGRRAALFRVLPNGRPDRSFGRRGVAQFEGQGESKGVSVLVGRDGSLLLGGSRQTGRDGVAPLLLRVTRNGAIDGSFARRSLAARPEYIEPRQLVAASGRIFGISGSVLTYRRDGAFLGEMPFAGKTKPPKYLKAGAPQGKGLVLLGQVGVERGFELRRYLPR